MGLTRFYCRLYKQVCMECASVTRGPDGGLQTREVQGDVVEEVTHLPLIGSVILVGFVRLFAIFGSDDRCKVPAALTWNARVFAEVLALQQGFYPVSGKHSGIEAIFLISKASCTMGFTGRALLLTCWLARHTTQSSLSAISCSCWSSETCVLRTSRCHAGQRRGLCGADLHHGAVPGRP